MTFMPRFRPQLGRGTPVPGRTRGSKDCGMRSFQHGFGALTHDCFVPTVKSIRTAMDREPYWLPSTGQVVVPGSNVWDMEEAARTYDRELARNGHKPIRVYKKFLTKSLKLAVRAGKPTQVALDYGVFNQVMGRTGDPNYTGGHSVLIAGEKRWPSGTIVWLLYDSLDDARRPEIPGPGPRWVPRWKVIRAARAWANKTTAGAEVVAGVFRGGQKR